MKTNKYSDLNKSELQLKKSELEAEVKKLLLNSSLTAIEKPHEKKALKVEIARVSSLLKNAEK